MFEGLCFVCSLFFWEAVLSGICVWLKFCLDCYFLAVMFEVYAVMSGSTYENS